jgi:hypothetical protein
LEGFAFNLRPNTRGSTGGYVFGRLIPKSFRSGVDILSDQNRQLLIRFRRTEGARTLGIASLDFDAFCNGPAAALSSAAPTELKVIERIQKGYPDLNMNTRRGLALGLFGGKVFSETFGVDFTELDNGVRTEIFERLRACALYHPNRSVGQTLINMLWGDEYTIDWHAADAYVAKHGRYWGAQ